MRLLWVLVVVGVAGGVTWEEEADELRREGFFFTATALREVGKDGEVEVVLTLEKSLHPHVTFDLTLLREEEKEVQWERKVLVTESVTLKVNEMRRVQLRVSDRAWEEANLFLSAYPTAHPEIRNQKWRYVKMKRVASEVEVFVQTDKDRYARGDSVDFRVVVVDGSVDKSPKFAQVVGGSHSWKEKKSLLPWVEVPSSGIARGSFPFGYDCSEIGASVTSDVTSRHSEATARPQGIRSILFSYPSSRWTSVELEGLSDVYFSQPMLKGRVTLTSSDGLPLEANCNVTIQLDPSGLTKFSKKLAERNVAVGLAGGEFEFDVVEELGAVRKGAADRTSVEVKASCSHTPSVSVKQTTRAVDLWRSLFRVDLMWVGGSPLPRNSSHPRRNVVAHFYVARRDGSSVEEEEEPLKELQVKLLLSEENLERLRPSATNFSLPIRKNGRVRLEFQVNDTPTFPAGDAVRMEVRYAEEEASLPEARFYITPFLRVTPVDPARLIRRGDVVRFRVRSCFPYGSVNAILSSSKAIVSAQRFSFSPLGDEVDEVIELTVPQNVTDGSLTLKVYGLNPVSTIKYNQGDSASIQVNLVPLSGPQSIKIVDKVGDDMSTNVTFRLEGLLAESVVSLQAAELESPEGTAEEKEPKEPPFTCHLLRNRINLGNRGIEIRDDSPGAVDPENIGISANNVNFIWERSSAGNPFLVFIDVDRKTSTENNGTLTVTKTFDRLTQFGTYVVSGATFNSKSGRTVFSNSPVLRILPPPVTLGVFVPPSVVLGETVEVRGYVKNNQATRFKGHVTLQISEGGSTEVREELVEINPNSYDILRMQATPGKLGELVVSLRSNISSRLTATKKLKVIPPKLNP